MITAAEILMGRDKEYPLTKELRDNLNRLVVALAVVRGAWGKPMTVTSGYRPGKYNTAAGGAKASSHLSCEACDFADPEGKLATWLVHNIPLLERAGLWLENPTYTKGWVHLQIRPVKSRIFIP